MCHAVEVICKNTVLGRMKQFITSFSLHTMYRATSDPLILQPPHGSEGPCFGITIYGELNSGVVGHLSEGNGAQSKQQKYNRILGMHDERREGGQ